VTFRLEDVSSCGRIVLSTFCFGNASSLGKHRYKNLGDGVVSGTHRLGTYYSQGAVM
jgi:hypothetical protein